MRPVLINGELWQVLRVDPDSPALIDKKGIRRIGTASGITKVISISSDVMPPLFDRVLLHEIAHAIMWQFRLPDELDEYLAQVIEHHAVEATVIASQSLGRQICVKGFCS